MQRVVVISYRLFRTTYRSHPQGSSIQKKACKQPSQPTKELTESRNLRKSASQRSSVCLAIPALTALLDSVTDTLNYNLDYIYTNNFLTRLKTPACANWGPCSRGSRPYEGT